MNRILRFTPGEIVSFNGDQYSIQSVIDFDSILATHLVDKTTRRLLIKDLITPDEAASSAEKGSVDLATVSDEDWQEAQFRFDIIRPLLKTGTRTANDVEERAKAAGVHRATVYRWLNLYEQFGVVSALLPTERSGGRGKSRLSAEVEVVIEATIKDFYLNKQKPSAQKTCEEVLRRCRNAKLPLPHPNTVRRRISILSERVKLERRISAKLAREKYDPQIGSFPGAEWPLSVVQIDHTKLDIILVDDKDRMPIGRPWITVGIDVFSRMIAGIYVSLDPPGALSVGLCIANAILPKDKWLAKLGITTFWPVWGVMKVIHADNAKEFRGEMLKRACLKYGIELDWRPVGKPQYGAHIERLMGTFNEEIHLLPGTTFSNTAERGEYDSDMTSALTLSEFENWLISYITGVYHQKVHSGIGTSPLKKFEEGIFGNDDRPGTGLPSLIVDEERLRLDLMPYLERSVQPYGIVIDEIHYYHDVLRTWINATDPENRSKKRLFLVRRDPRDISVVYFYDPEVKTYYEIPYRDTSHQPMSLWELKEVKRRLQEEGRKDINEDLIFDTFEKMRAMEAEAVKVTKKMRRDRQRRKIHKSASEPLRVLREKVVETETPNANSEDRIAPFDDLEEL